MNKTTATTNENDLTVGQWVARYPQSARVFESRGIDYCCGGKRTLEEACGRLGLNAAALRVDLGVVVREAPAIPETDWEQVSVGALIDHIESTHHQYIRAERPRLTALAHKVARVHGSRHLELEELAVAVDRVFLELEPHLEQEETVFFPACRKWEKAAIAGAPDPSLIEGVEGLEAEHVELGRILETIRSLTHGFEPPHDACNSYLALFQGLEQLEADLHQHIHKENNILHARLRLAGPNGNKIGTIVDAGKAEPGGSRPVTCCDV